MSTVPSELDRRFRETAASDGLLDVGYDLLDSPVGPLLVAATPRGVCRISYDADPEAQAERLARAYGLRVLRAPRAVDDVRRELDEYFAGKRHDFDLKLDLSAAPAFTRSVLDLLAQVPYGEVTTYGTLAARVGSPRAARAVGTVMNRNPIPIVLPCHRVVGSSGSLVGYAGGLDRKHALLRLEGARLWLRLALREPEDQQDENDDQQDADDSAWNHAIHLLDGESSRTCPLGGGVKPGFRERLPAAQ